jgi:transcriptional regulator with XRE-family HTH domain
MEKYSNAALGEVVRELREHAGMTQVELGRGAGYGSGEGVSISRLENGLVRPGVERLAGIAETLGLSLGELEAKARDRDTAEGTSRPPEDGDGQQTDTGSADARTPPSQRELNARRKRIEEVVQERSGLVQSLGDAFNMQLERAESEFLEPFIDVARRVEGAPQPEPSELDDVPDATTSGTADLWVQANVNSVVRTIASGATGAAVGGAVGGATAYGAFAAAMSFGTASTGTAISALSGAAATKAAVALFGGGSLATGGAGVAGGAAVLMGIAAAPMAIFLAGGLAYASRRNRKQRQELAAQLDAAEAGLAATAAGVDALRELLPQATTTFDYIATHAGHAVGRWRDQLNPGPMSWESLGSDGQERYLAFIDIAGAQQAIATLSFESLVVATDDDRNELVQLTDQVLRAAHETVQRHV